MGQARFLLYTRFNCGFVGVQTQTFTRPKSSAGLRITQRVIFAKSNLKKHQPTEN